MSRTATVKYVKEGKFGKHLFVSNKTVCQDSFIELKSLSQKLEKLFKDQFICAKLNINRDVPSVFITANLNNEVKELGIALEPHAIYKITYATKLMDFGKKKVCFFINSIELVKSGELVSTDFVW